MRLKLPSILTAAVVAFASCSPIAQIAPANVLPNCRRASALADEVGDLVEQEGVTEHVLELISFVSGSEFVELARRYKSATNVAAQVGAWRILIRECPSSILVLEGLRSPNASVRSLAAAGAATVGLDDVTIDSLLEEMVRDEHGLQTIRNASLALVARLGREGAVRVFNAARQRDLSKWNWEPVLQALAGSPDPMYEPLFRHVERESPSQSCLAGRGLRALGVADIDPRAGQLSASLTDFEFGERAKQLEQSLKDMHVSSWSAFVYEAAAAQVVVIGEAHSNPCCTAAEIAILAALQPHWQSSLALALERPRLMDQEPILDLARKYGHTVLIPERETDRQRLVHERDLEASDKLIAELHARPDCRLLVIYGDAHRASLAERLRAEGASVVEVSLSGGQAMIGDAIRVLGTLDIVHQVLKYSTATYYMPVMSYSNSGGAKALETAIARRHAALPGRAPK